MPEPYYDKALEQANIAQHRDNLIKLRDALAAQPERYTRGRLVGDTVNATQYKVCSLGMACELFGQGEANTTYQSYWYIDEHFYAYPPDHVMAALGFSDWTAQVITQLNDTVDEFAHEPASTIALVSSMGETLPNTYQPVIDWLTALIDYKEGDVWPIPDPNTGSTIVF